MRHEDLRLVRTPGGGPSLAALLPGVDLVAPLQRNRVPSPLDCHPGLSRELGVELWMKREDLIDDLGCGHKARKLAYVATDALAAGATVLITAASLPSGQAVAVAAFANRLGIRSHIVYCGDHQQRPSTLRGNYLLVSLLGATVTWRERAPWTDWPTYLDAAADQERAAGETPYLVQPGLAGWPGLLGSIELGAELAGQLGDAGRDVHVVGAAGSGGSLFGVGVGLRAAGMRARVHGVCIGAPLDAVAAGLSALREHAASHLPADGVADVSVELHDGARGAGYDSPDDAVFEAIRCAAADHALLLDPTYMAKTFIGLRQLVEMGRIPQGARVVFVLSGGSAELFAGGGRFDSWTRRRTPGRTSLAATATGSTPP